MSLASPKVVTKTAAYTAQPNECVLATATGAFTVTLPLAADGFGRGPIIVKKVDASGNAVTVDGAGAETIDGAATVSLGAQWASVTVISNGTAWFTTSSV